MHDLFNKYIIQSEEVLSELETCNTISFHFVIQQYRTLKMHDYIIPEIQESLVRIF